jgi:hypothetical protein
MCCTLQASKSALDLINYSLVGVLLGVVVALLLLLELLPEVLSLDELLLDVALLVEIVLVQKLIERISGLIVLEAELVVILPRCTVFVAAALAVMAEHLHLLRIDVILNQKFEVVIPMAEVQVSSQILALGILDRHFVQPAAVCPILHDSKVFEVTISGMVS